MLERYRTTPAVTRQLRSAAVLYLLVALIGPIGLVYVPDKLFVFGGFEGLKTNRATPVYGYYPCPASANLNCPDAITYQPPTYQLGQYVAPTFPVPQTQNGAPTILGQYNYSTTPTTTDNYNEYTIRADQQITPRK